MKKGTKIFAFVCPMLRMGLLKFRTFLEVGADTVPLSDKTP
jgi:hypothetical protein